MEHVSIDVTRGKSGYARYGLLDVADASDVEKQGFGRCKTSDGFCCCSRIHLSSKLERRCCMDFTCCTIGCTLNGSSSAVVYG